ncbi:fatty acid oxidation complex subunit alpha FadB [Methylocapsa acidiphila]|uniref:fatty acid oxidation complex subunit alpha FadB n=1 Tax=Methylocapsa acidiphila TaxID=133552 RepID=UPI0003F9D15E|nr:fatty acid oxidation complex subunit alpha FadB [Methylocapsa acidiphila]
MLFDGQTIKIEELGDGLVELRFARGDEPVNKLDKLAFDELRRAIDILAAAPGIKGALITSGKDAFIVGADIFEFTALFKETREAISAFVAQNSAILTALGELPFPTVAEINGFALGGGFELALAADYRVMSTAAKIGVPEIHLGIFPGYGGTARLPRLIGLGAGADWIISGAQQTAETALRLEAVDAMATPDILRPIALAKLGQAVSGEADWRRRRLGLKSPLGHSKTEAAELLATAKSHAANALPHLPAAHLAVELLEEAAGLDRDAALALEAEAFGEAAKTQAAVSLVRIFINEQALKKTAKSYAKTALPVRKAAAVGAGVMGGGIAYQSALRGVPIIMKDIAESALDLGMAEARKLLARQVEQGRLAQDKADAVLASITPTLAYEGFDQVNVVIEAVVEILSVKKTVLRDIEALVGAQAVISSNTSSLRIGDLAESLNRPENFIGMHFFNPVPRMALVEVVRGPKTSEQAIATIVGYASAMGKTPIVVQDCPGFVVNRALTPYLIAFLQLVRDGADFAAIDRAMEGFGWPMGPAYLIDVIGMDISHHVVEIVSAGFPDRMQAPASSAIDVLLREKRLGQKNGRGFYTYSRDSKGRPRKEPDPETERLLAEAQPNGKRDIGEAEIVERMMLPLIFEAARCVEDGVVAAPGEADMCLILGLGLPRYLGGALAYADYLGLANVAARAKAWESFGAIYRPGASLRALAANGGAFYPA